MVGLGHHYGGTYGCGYENISIMIIEQVYPKTVNPSEQNVNPSETSHPNAVLINLSFWNPSTLQLGLIIIIYNK